MAPEAIVRDTRSKPRWRPTKTSFARRFDKLVWQIGWEFSWGFKHHQASYYLVGGLVAIFGIFPLILGMSNHPNWWTYFSEGWPNHQPDGKFHGDFYRGTSWKFRIFPFWDGCFFQWGHGWFPARHGATPMFLSLEPPWLVIWECHGNVMKDIGNIYIYISWDTIFSWTFQWGHSHRSRMFLCCSVIFLGSSFSWTKCVMKPQINRRIWTINWPHLGGQSTQSQSTGFVHWRIWLWNVNRPSLHDGIESFWFPKLPVPVRSWFSKMAMGPICRWLSHKKEVPMARGSQIAMLCHLSWQCLGPLRCAQKGREDVHASGAGVEWGGDLPLLPLGHGTRFSPGISMVWMTNNHGSKMPTRKGVSLQHERWEWEEKDKPLCGKYKIAEVS